MLSFSNFPFKPNKVPVYYGWIIIIVAIIGTIMSIPGQTMGISVFTESLIKSFSITRNQISATYGIGTFASAMILTFAGKMYDRFGARILTPIAAFMLALVLVFFTKIEHISTLIQGVWFKLLLLVIGFWGIRFFGQGVLTLCARNMAMKWFDHKRGLANGIMGLAVSFGFSSSPFFLNYLVGKYNWDGAWIVLAIIVGGGFLLVSLLFYRDNPEECGMIPDGRKPVLVRKNKPKVLPDQDYTLQEARSTYTFWVFNLTLMMFSLYFTALTFHVESIFEKAGMDKEKAFSIFLPASAIAVVIHFIGSWISDYVKLKYFLKIQLIGFLISMFGVMMLGKISSAYPLLIIGHGIANGTFSILIAVTWPRFFGKTHLGAISGYSMSWMVAGSAVGPLLFSYLTKVDGTYIPGILICAVISLVLLVMGFRANNIVDGQKVFNKKD